MINKVQTWDCCPDLVVASDTPEEAQNRFQAWLAAGQDDSTELEIKKIVAAQFLDRLLSESGDTSLDWPRIHREADAQLEATPADDSEQGYWVEVNDLLAPGRTAATVEQLRAGLPEDVRDGLNWSPDRLFFFIVIVLHGHATTEVNHDPVSPHDAATEGGGGCGGEAALESEMPFPELAERDAAALVKVRNTVVAAWLWRRFVGGTPLAGNRIQLIPWCGAIGFEGGA
jgi:hypothetical protein